MSNKFNLFHKFTRNCVLYVFNDLQIQNHTIDISKIITYNHKKRLFRIFDRDYKYKLLIYYKELVHVTAYTYGYGKSISFVPYTRTDPETVLEIRFLTEEDLIFETSKIYYKICAYNEITKKIENENELYAEEYIKFIKKLENK